MSRGTAAGSGPGDDAESMVPDAPAAVTGRVSDESGGSGVPAASASSSPPTAGAATGKIHLTHRTRVEDGRVVTTFTVSPSERVASGLSSGAEGDHVTAYSTFIELVCTALTTDNTSTISEKIRKIAAVVVSTEELTAFNASLLALETRHLGQTLETMRAARKTTTAEMVLVALAPEHVARAKAGMKFTERELHAQFIEDAALLLLEHVNIGRNIAFAKSHASAQVATGAKTTLAGKKRGRVEAAAPPDTAEGSRVRQANLALRAIHRLAEMEKLFGPTGSLLDTTTPPQQRRTIEKFYDDLKKPRSELVTGLREIEVTLPSFFRRRGASAPAPNLSEKSRVVSELVTEFRKMKEPTTTAVGRPSSSGTRSRTAPASSPSDKIARRIVSSVGNLFDFSRARHAGDPNIFDTLTEVTARHFNIVSFAFGLDKFDEVIRRKVFDNFLEKIVLGVRVVDSGGRVTANGQAWSGFQDIVGEFTLDRLRLKLTGKIPFLLTPTIAPTAAAASAAVPSSSPLSPSMAPVAETAAGRGST